jgi:hypothetical protein
MRRDWGPPVLCVVDVCDEKHDLAIAVERQVHMVKRVGNPPDVPAGAAYEPLTGVGMHVAVARLPNFTNIPVFKAARRLTEGLGTAGD